MAERRDALRTLQIRSGKDEPFGPQLDLVTVLRVWDTSRISFVGLGIVNAARPGTYLRVALFTLDLQPMDDALVVARQRGMKVQVVADQETGTWGWSREVPAPSRIG